MGCAHSRKKKCASKSGNSKDQTEDVKKEYDEKREVLDENIKQNVFESRNNLRVDETEKLVFRKRSWRYEDKVQEIYPDFLNPFENEENDNVSIELEENESNDQDENILDYPIELNPFSSTDDENSIEDSEVSQEEDENSLQDENILDNPIELNPFLSTDDEDSTNESEIIQEENENLKERNNTEYHDSMIPNEIINQDCNPSNIHVPVEKEDAEEDCFLVVPSTSRVKSLELNNENSQHLLKKISDIEESGFKISKYDEDKITSKKESLENNFNNLKENVGVMVENGEDKNSFDVGTSSNNRKDIITINISQVVSNKTPNALSAGIKDKNVKRPALPPPSSEIFPSENKTIPEKVTSTPMKKDIEIKIARKAPPPPGSRIEARVLNDCMDSTAELSQFYRNLRPAPSPPSSELFPSENKTTPEKVTSTPIKKDIEIKIARKVPPPPGSRIEACVLNDCTNSTDELPQVYRNLRPAPSPPPSSELFLSENKTIPEKVTSTPMKEDIEIKIARKAPPPPVSRIEACVLNDCTNSTDELPQVYRNLRPAPYPPMGANYNIDTTLQTKLIPDNDFGRKPLRKSLLDLFKVKKKKKIKN